MVRKTNPAGIGNQGAEFTNFSKPANFTWTPTEPSFHVVPSPALADWEVFPLKNGAIFFLEKQGWNSSNNSVLNERRWTYAGGGSMVPSMIPDRLPGIGYPS